MRRVLRRRPSPALVIAGIALFVSLGGVSYGLATGSVDSRELKNNTVRSKDLRNNGATTRDIRNRTIRGRDVRDNTLTGTQIDESTLGSVPTANTANTAGSADSADSAESFGGMSAQRIASFTLANGQARSLGTFGPFTLSATCTINAANTDTATINITTSQNNSVFWGEFEDADFDVGDTIAWVQATVTPTGTPFADEDGPLVLGPDGTEIFGHQLYATVNTLGQVGSCRFGGVLFQG
jgi:hypothetical protein